MADDLKIVLTTELEADEQSSANRIAQQLPSIEKMINQQAKIKLGVEINTKLLQDQARVATRQVNDILTKNNVKINIGLEEENISKLQSKLKELKIDNAGAKELTKELTAMNVILDKVRHSWVDIESSENNASGSVRQLVNLLIQGTTEEGKLVSITKQYDVASGEVVRTQTSITDNIKAQEEAQKRLAKQAQADNDSRIKYLADQRNILKDIEASYTGKTSKRGVNDIAHIKSLKQEYKNLETEISKLDSQEGALSQKQKSNIETKIADLKRLVKEYQNAEYIATQLRTKDITPIKDEQLSKLAQFETKLQSAGLLTDDFRSRISDLTGQLSNAFDHKTLTSFLNSFDALKLDVSIFESEISGLNAKYKELQSISQEIFRISSKMVKVDSSSQEYASLNSELKLQLDYRQRISAEIESMTKRHPEMVQYASEYNKYIQQTSINSERLATAESKVADEVAKIASSIREQAVNNTFLNSIDSLETKFKSLSTVSSDATATMQSEFTLLQSLLTVMQTSTNNQEVIAAHEQFEAVLSRTANSLDILTRSEKTNEQAARDQAKATQEAAKAQATMTQSSTLSNKIEAWMNQNTAAAQRFGTELRNLQSQLTNNINPTVLKQVRNEFSLIQSQAKAAGLVTNHFVQSIKNVGLQVLGLSSAVLVIRKLISVFKEGIDTVIELDTSLVDLKKTTTMSGTSLVEFYQEANKAAKELGTTTKEIIQSAADWSRLGFSDKNSAESMAKLTAQFAAISPGMSMDDATTGLVSVIKAYGIEVEDVLDGVMSKINIVGNTAATSNDQIITGLQNSASAMAAMNSTLDENIALFTAAQEISQDASRVGNALRTISMRIRGYDEETEQLSEDLANISGEVVDLTKTVSKPIGVSLFTDATQTEYKSIYQYLKEISEIYDDLGAKQQQDLMEKLFGKMRANIGQAIIANFGAAEKAMDNMAKSAGNADAEMEIITESLAFKLNKLKETGVGVFQDMFQREDVGVAIDILTKFLQLIGAITTALGPLGSVLAGVGIAAFVKNLG